MNFARSKLTALLLVIASAISVSPLILATGTVKGNIVSLISLISIYFVKQCRVSQKSVILVGILFALSVINVVYWGQLTLRVSIYFYSILLLIFFLKENDIYDFINYMSRLLIFLLGGAVIGYLWALGGGEAIFTIQNEDTRTNGFYLTTFSNTYLNGLIRPSGIFDEPGAFSLIICLVVALRESIGASRKVSWALLILGLITMSTAHAIFIVLYWIKTKWVTPGKTIISVVVVSSVLLLLMTFDNPIVAVMKCLLNRFRIVDGAFVGDNRSVLIVNALNYLDLKTFLFGLDGDCILNLPSCSSKGYVQYLANPFTLLVHYGIFISLPYYLTMAYLMLKAIKQRNLIVFGVFLLLLQRPYVMSYGYAVLIMIYVYSLHKKQSYKKLVNYLPPRGGILPGVKRFGLSQGALLFSLDREVERKDVGVL